MNQERLLKLIMAPHISEKATVAMENNVYVFEVISSATKPEVKDAVKHLFNAEVKNVRMVNVRPKKKLFKGQEGNRKGWKKAYVTLQAGQKIEIMGAQ
jgi:large subunit ribosomal protein L23